MGVHNAWGCTYKELDFNAVEKREARRIELVPDGVAEK
jgi:hypothetical protein